MRRTDCVDCMALLNDVLLQPPGDIPETERRVRAVWDTLECTGAHTLDAWVAAPAVPTRESRDAK